MIVTIDGPAASGKSTTAKLVAKKLGISYLDTGGMYRCITFSFMKNNISYNEISLAKSHLKKLNLSIREKNDRQHFYINGIDITNEIRSNEVSKNVSKFSSLYFVRDKTFLRVYFVAFIGEFASAKIGITAYYCRI